ncbi:MAG: RNA polymerase sigma factor [Bacteroidota bacterium]|jgi:RNA polymerase sigma-70 factor (ECF subfamily)|nr:sigma-70 family RNA polymerase sigma factor [Bacteroidota bacterium]MCA6442989.1 sigma-70 family RNA polymerase sigma factor [Bacteroidota bacterium]
MLSADTLSTIQKQDKEAIRHVFEEYYPTVYNICLRYCKNDTQAKEAVNLSFDAIFDAIQSTKNLTSIQLTEFIKSKTIQCCIELVKSIRSEYYVASTVYANSPSAKNYNLFEDTTIIDYNAINSDVLIKTIQQLVPSQRLIFNLHVLDGYNLQDSSLLLEANEQTAKSNLEKARFNLQKGIEKNFKAMKQHEQSF